jgi:hypothetical protein
METSGNLVIDKTSAAADWKRPSPVVNEATAACHATEAATGRLHARACPWVWGRHRRRPVPTTNRCLLG